MPALRDSQELPEAERTRGAALADRLSVPVLARAWQMLLKGVGEVETAPDRRAAAEMVLIRLCHVSDLPPPGDLVRRLSDGADAGVRPARAARHRPVAAARARSPAAAPDRRRPTPPPAPGKLPRCHRPGRRAARGDAARASDPLGALVRFAPPVIELRPQPEAPKDLASRLGALLTEATGTRWTIALSTAEGEPTVAEQGTAADAARRTAAADHPLVRAIMDAFPGARIDTVHDTAADAYGLPQRAGRAGSPADAEFRRRDGA